MVSGQHTPGIRDMDNRNMNTCCRRWSWLSLGALTLCKGRQIGGGWLSVKEGPNILRLEEGASEPSSPHIRIKIAKLNPGAILFNPLHNIFKAHAWALRRMGRKAGEINFRVQAQVAHLDKVGPGCFKEGDQGIKFCFGIVYAGKEKIVEGNMQSVGFGFTYGFPDMGKGEGGRTIVRVIQVFTGAVDAYTNG